MKRKFNKGTTNKPNLEETFMEYIQEKKDLGRSDDTLRNYLTSYRIFKDFFELPSSFLLEDLTEKMFYQWRQDMIEREMRPQTINHYVRDWRTFLNWCEVRELLPQSIKLKEMKAQEDLPKMYSDEEIQKMLIKPREGDSYTTWRNWAIVNLIYSTGLRASSVCALTIGDLDFKKGYITIPQQKNKKAGMLPITSVLERVLKEFIKKWYDKDEPSTNYLFQNVSGEQLTVNALHNSIQRYCDKFGIKGHGVHSIRHNFARDMILNGGGEYRLQAYLQHSNIQMSQHYVKLFSGDLKRDAEVYNPLDNMKKKQNRTSKFRK